MLLRRGLTAAEKRTAHDKWMESERREWPLHQITIKIASYTDEDGNPMPEIEKFLII